MIFCYLVTVANCLLIPFWYIKDHWKDGTFVVFFFVFLHRATSRIRLHRTRTPVLLSLAPTCPKNRKNQGVLRFSDVWDSYDQWKHLIPDIPDGRRFLRRDRKNRKHFYFEGSSQTVPDVGDFYNECEHEIYLSGTSGMLEFVFSCYQSLVSSELSIINV